MWECEAGRWQWHCPSRDITSVTTQPRPITYFSQYTHLTLSNSHILMSSSVKIFCICMTGNVCCCMNLNLWFTKKEWKNKKSEKRTNNKYFPHVVMNKLTDQYPGCDMPPVTMTPVSRVTRDTTLPPLSSSVIAHILHREDETREYNLFNTTRGHRLLCTA